MKTHTMQCGCAFECDDNSARWVISCNLHAAAPLLLEAVKNVILGHVIQYTRGMEELCAAIAAAEKEEHNGQHL